jgi:hypothetical protein
LSGRPRNGREKLAARFGLEVEHLSRRVPWPVLDIRSLEMTAEKAAEYAVKTGVIAYITKGDKTVEPLSPVHAASIYEATEGVRCVQWARGWAPQKHKSEHTWRLVRTKSPEESLCESASAREHVATCEGQVMGVIYPMKIGPP